MSPTKDLEPSVDADRASEFLSELVSRKFAAAD